VIGPFVPMEVRCGLVEFVEMLVEMETGWDN
jgi:hypothetical protein